MTSSSRLMRSYLLRLKTSQKEECEKAPCVRACAPSASSAMLLGRSDGHVLCPSTVQQAGPRLTEQIAWLLKRCRGLQCPPTPLPPLLITPSLQQPSGAPQMPRYSKCA